MRHVISVSPWFTQRSSFLKLYASAAGFFDREATGAASAAESYAERATAGSLCSPRTLDARQRPAALQGPPSTMNDVDSLLAELDDVLDDSNKAPPPSATSALLSRGKR